MKYNPAKWQDLEDLREENRILRRKRAQLNKILLTASYSVGVEIGA